MKPKELKAIEARASKRDTSCNPNGAIEKLHQTEQDRDVLLAELEKVTEHSTEIEKLKKHYYYAYKKGLADNKRLTADNAKLTAELEAAQAGNRLLSEALRRYEHAPEMVTTTLIARGEE